MTRPARPRIATIVVAMLFVAVLGAAVPSFAADTAPVAAKSRKCRAVPTLDGGRARFIVSIAARCRTARRVARRAGGGPYRAFGFKCKPAKKQGVRGLVYGCGRYKNGRAQGVGFVYTKP